MDTTFYFRRISVTLACTLAVATPFALQAHETRAGAIGIEHAYAVPSLAGSRNGVAYVVRIRNEGPAPDKLLRAVSPVAGRVELHNMGMNAQGVMQMREVDGIAVEPKGAVEMKPGMGYHFMLMDLKQPLKDGDSFPMTLVFEKAGSVDVKVVVQTPKAGAGQHPH